MVLPGLKSLNGPHGAHTVCTGLPPDVISEEIENDVRSERQVLGNCHATERIQRAQIVLQTKLLLKRNQTNKDLSYLNAKPLRTHTEVMESINCTDRLLGMKELANGACFRAYDYDMRLASSMHSLSRKWLSRSLLSNNISIFRDFCLR